MLPSVSCYEILYFYTLFTRNICHTTPFPFLVLKTRNLEGEDATLHKIKHSKRVNLSQPCLTGKEDKRIESLPQIQVF